MPKNVKGGPLGVFEHPFFCKTEKNEGGPFRHISEKKSQSQNILHKKFSGKGRDPNTRPSAWQTSKILKISEAEEATLATLVLKKKTSRERPKSAPNLRFKIAKGL